MKPTYILSLYLAATTALFAQRPDTPWQINAGLNVVDFFPTGGENIFFLTKVDFSKILEIATTGMLAFRPLVYIVP